MTDRILRAIAALVTELTVPLRYYGLYEYRVVLGTAAIGFALQPVRARTGMPALTGVRLFSAQGAPATTYLPGATVLVGFIDGDPARPFIAHDGAVVRHGEIASHGVVVAAPLLKVPPP